jgi:hypothetical protein
MDLLNRIGAKWLGAAIADGLVRDFRYAQRSLRKDYRFSLVAILALALGIGASTVVFSVVYNAIFETVPYQNFARLVVFKINNLANAGGSRKAARISFRMRFVPFAKTTTSLRTSSPTIIDANI